MCLKYSFDTIGPGLDLRTKPDSFKKIENHKKNRLSMLRACCIYFKNRQK